MLYAQKEARLFQQADDEDEIDGYTMASGYGLPQPPRNRR
jgi:hypothetical protein